MTAALYVRVLSEKCCGYRLCNQLGPQVYVLDEMGFASAPEGALPPEFVDGARAGAEACPEEAIVLSDTPFVTAEVGGAS